MWVVYLCMKLVSQQSLTIFSPVLLWWRHCCWVQPSLKKRRDFGVVAIWRQLPTNTVLNWRIWNNRIMHDYLCFHIWGGRCVRTAAPDWSGELAGDRVSAPSYCLWGGSWEDRGGKERRSREGTDGDTAAVQNQLVGWRSKERQKWNRDDYKSLKKDHKNDCTTGVIGNKHRINKIDDNNLKTYFPCGLHLQMFLSDQNCKSVKSTAAKPGTQLQHWSLIFLSPFCLLSLASNFRKLVSTPLATFIPLVLSAASQPVGALTKIKDV